MKRSLALLLAPLLVLFLHGQTRVVGEEVVTAADDFYVYDEYYDKTSLGDELYENSKDEFWDSSKEASCCSSTCPSWSGRVGWVQLWREYTSNVPLVGPVGGGAPLLSFSDLDFDSRAGFDTSISWDNGCGWGIDFRYLWVDGFSGMDSRIAALNPQILTAVPTQNTYAPGDTLVSNYRSNIQSAELLGHRAWGRFDVTAGFRYVELDESLRIDVNSGIPKGPTGFGAANDMYGFQLGLEGPLWDNCGRFRVEGFSKVGIYYNDIGAAAFTDNQFNGAFSGSGVGNSDYTSFVAEFGVYGTYDVTCNLSVRCGYQLMYLDGVALAADQVPNTGGLDAAPGTTPVIAHGGNSVLYHGLNVGLEYRY